MPLANGRKAYAPETAVGTGAKFPLVDPVAAAAEVPSIDQATAANGGANGNNKPRANEDEIEVSGDELAEPTDTRNSTGEDEETRENTAAHARDGDVNKVASVTRPTAPQAKRSNARPKTAVVKEGLPK